MSQSLEINVVSWLRPKFEYYGRKKEFDVKIDDWGAADYAEFVKLAEANPTIVEVFPNKQVTDENGQPAITGIKVKPPGVGMLREQPRKVHRQVTINNEKVDLRSERALMILTPPIENLELVARVWLRQLESETEPRVLRRIRMDLLRLLAWRGKELSMELKDRICNLSVVCT